MIVWQFTDPCEYDYARASRRGTWSPSPAPGVCPECTASQQQRVQPLIVEWEPDSDVIGDFVWPGFDDEVVVTDRAFTSLAEHFSGFEAGPVEMYQDPKLRRPKRITKRSKPRVWLPYEGPMLHDLWVTTWVHVDMRRSSVRQTKKCLKCGYESYEVDGVEEHSSRWDEELEDTVKIHKPRAPGKGLFITGSILWGADIFKVHEFPGCVLCTDRVRDYILREGFTNVGFLEVGTVME